MRLRNLFVALIFITILVLEDFAYFEDLPQHTKDLKEWGDKFHNEHQFPLYGIVLASSTDSNVIENRPEFAAFSGQQCCFIYFRDLERVTNQAKFNYEREHQRWAEAVAELLGIHHIPGILFFEKVDSGEYVYLSLQGKSQREISNLVHDLFDYVNHHLPATPYSSLKEFADSLPAGQKLIIHVNYKERLHVLRVISARLLGQ